MRRWLLVPAFIALALAVALADPDAGVRSGFRLHRDLWSARERIAGLHREVNAMRAETQALRDDPVALERAIREDLELARPGEVIVQWPADTDSTVRIH